MNEEHLNILTEDTNVINYDFSSHRKRKEFIQNFIAQGNNVSIVQLHEPDLSNMLGVARITFFPERKAALFSSLILNPDYVQNAEAWMIYFLPSILTFIASFQPTVVYTNLPPAFEEAIAGYLEYGFKKIDEDKCFKSNNIVYSSLYFEMNATH